MTRIFALIIIVIAAVTVGSPLVAQTDTTFTYQGSLGDGGSPASGSYDLDFSLWDADTVRNQIGSAVQYTSLPVIEGLFTVELDFGASAFDNTSRWLEIAVDGNTLSPRQPISRSPYSIQTRGIVVNANNEVGIGTSTPRFPLHVESDGIFSIVSLSHGTSGVGVFGEATANTGTNYGVFGTTGSTSGRGVFGQASGTTGTTSGVWGANSSVTGRGVFGQASATTGLNYGVFGTTGSTSGRGVFGEAPASTGTTYGVYGLSKSTGGRGVYGIADASSGNTYGGYFEAPGTGERC